MLDMAIAIVYLQKRPGKPRNMVSLFDRHGRLCLIYAKDHTCDFEKEAALTSGDKFYVCDLDTAQGELKIS
jgi:predicted amidohydrolase